MPVLQSGNITPGNVAVWGANGVIMDGGALVGAERVLASLSGADMNDTNDQPIPLPSRTTAFMLTRILVTNSAVSLTGAVGGFYPQASKAGTALVASSQVYSSLTSATKLLSCTLEAAVATTRYSVANLTDWTIYFSLTTAQGIAATADIYICGIDLTV